MANYSTPGVLARRDLTYRIERYLADLEKRDAVPGRREGSHLLRALAHLEAGNLAEGERQMIWADAATRRREADETYPMVTLQELRQRFTAMGGAEGRARAAPSTSPKVVRTR